ncbi:hypothetical protein F5Y19DRAFT_141168 [Xylariaceae sp. FL1651]|nr:hypothetical protein F5Y19DRAFT_141168 [Xylariaceae sp. FL1651]
MSQNMNVANPPQALVPQEYDEVAIRAGDPLFVAKVLRFSDMNVSSFDFMFGHPGVQKLVLDHCFWDLLTNLRGQSNSQVSRVELLGCNINEHGFKDILTSFDQLRQLVYYRPVDETDTDFDLIGEVLEEHGHHLEHLEMHNDALMPFYSPVGSLQGLVSLKTLDMHLELLIGFRENPREGYDEYMDGAFDTDQVLNYQDIHADVGDWSLVELLPASLEDLTLFVEDPKIDTYFNTYAEYGAKFEELITAESRFPKLRRVKAPFVGQVADKLRGRLTGWELKETDTLCRVSAAWSSSDENY